MAASNQRTYVLAKKCSVVGELPYSQTKEMQRAEIHLTDSYQARTGRESKKKGSNSMDKAHNL